MSDDNAPDKPVVGQQQTFNALVDKASKDYDRETNSVAKRLVIEKRDISIAMFVGDGKNVANWQGEILAVASMDKNAGISVRIGRARLLAGVHLGRGVDTTIRPADPLYMVAAGLKTGDKVAIDGTFPIEGGHPLELSYTLDSSASKPSYLFRFSRIESLSK